MPVTVNVKIGAANVKPTRATAIVTASPDPRSGVVTGTIGAVDADGDVLSYTAGTTTKGTVTLNADGSFTYTPTAAARLAASKAGATVGHQDPRPSPSPCATGSAASSTKATSVKVTIAAEPARPTRRRDNGVGHGVRHTSTAIGTVTGTVTATDAGRRRADLQRWQTGPAFGVVTVSADAESSPTPPMWTPATARW